MPCHLIVAHSNSWSSDTDKWTCVITLDFFVTFHSVKTASAQHVTKKQTGAIAVSSINLSLFLSVLCLYNHSPTTAWQWMGGLRVWGGEIDGGQSETDGPLHSPFSFVNTFCLERASRQGETELVFYFSRLLHMEKEKSGKGGTLIKIQSSLPFSLLPFQSFYSFKSLTISMKLKGSSSRLWNSDTFDNNAFEELVTSSSQISLINAQTVFSFLPASFLLISL